MPARSKAKAPAKRKTSKNVTLTVSLAPRKGQEAALESEIRKLIRPTRAERGCLKYVLHRSTDKPGNLFLYEVWASREALERHWQSPHFLRWKERNGAFVASYERFFWDALA